MSLQPATTNALIAAVAEQLTKSGFQVDPPPAAEDAKTAAWALFSLAAQAGASFFTLWADEVDEGQVVGGVSLFFLGPDAVDVGRDEKVVRQRFAYELHQPLADAIAELARRGADPKRPMRGEVVLTELQPAQSFRVLFKDGELGAEVEAVVRDSRVRSAFPPISERPLAARDAAWLEDELLRLEGFFRGHLLLISGPRGAGRTTTLHAAIEALPDDVRALAAIEQPRGRDPRLGRVLRPSPELSLAQAVRAFLRQDPELVVMDEVRTPEELELAINAALTGHAVFAVLEAAAPEDVQNRLRELNLPITALIVHHERGQEGDAAISLHVVDHDGSLGPAKVQAGT